jgi:hypothetical protein
MVIILYHSLVDVYDVKSAHSQTTQDVPDSFKHAQEKSQPLNC